MIMRTLLIFTLLLASVGLGVQFYKDPGYLLISTHHLSIETTLTVAIVGVMLIFIILHVLLILLHKVTHIPTSWSAWRTRRRAHHAQAKTRQGLIEFSEGHWLQARTHLINALPGTETPLLNYLTAARAAQEMGDSKLRDNYLREAQQSMPEAKIAVELTQAQLQLANRQWEQALATLKHLHDLAPNHPYVLKLLMHLYQEVGDWPQLIALLPKLKRHSVISDACFNELQKKAYLGHMNDLTKQNQIDALTDLIASLPKKLANDPDLTAEYAQFLIDTHADTQAELLLRRNLTKRFNDRLITLYGQLNKDTSRLNFAESLIKDNSHDASLYLCLGRISQSKHLWGKAKTYLEKSIERSPSPAAYAQLGQLLEQLEDSEGATCAYRQGLLLALL